ncbi:MAG: hypothetical protein FWD19_01090 [Defluviitaleaceae bacterium]|nr:hypothetical protein [Defluviitaleaceae bacterium]
MAVVNRPYSARLNLVNTAGEVTQTLTRVRSDLTGSEGTAILAALNFVRPSGSQNLVVGGRYIISDELAEA